MKEIYILLYNYIKVVKLKYPTFMRNFIPRIQGPTKTVQHLERSLVLDSIKYSKYTNTCEIGILFGVGSISIKHLKIRYKQM